MESGAPGIEGPGTLMGCVRRDFDEAGGACGCGLVATAFVVDQFGAAVWREPHNSVPPERDCLVVGIGDCDRGMDAGCAKTGHVFEGGKREAVRRHKNGDRIAGQSEDELLPRADRGEDRFAGSLRNSVKDGRRAKLRERGRDEVSVPHRDATRKEECIAARKEFGRVREDLTLIVGCVAGLDGLNKREGAEERLKCCRVAIAELPRLRCGIRAQDFIAGAEDADSDAPEDQGRADAARSECGRDRWRDERSGGENLGALRGVLALASDEVIRGERLCNLRVERDRVAGNGNVLDPNNAIGPQGDGRARHDSRRRCLRKRDGGSTDQGIPSDRKRAGSEVGEAGCEAIHDADIERGGGAIGDERLGEDSALGLGQGNGFVRDGGKASEERSDGDGGRVKGWGRGRGHGFGRLTNAG